MTEVNNPYDNPARAKARREQEDPWVMYLIVRESLGMSAGKAAAQVGHAVGMLYGTFMKRHEDMLFMSKHWDPARHPATDAQLQKMASVHQFDSWMQDSFRKIVLRAKDGQWEKLKEQLECYVVRDAGFTEVAPGSETVIGLWPMRKSQRPDILKRLQVLK